MQEQYNQAEYDGDLVCTSNDAIVTQLSYMPSTCVPATMINATINAQIQVQGTKYDVGWYVAAAGGDALTGTCVGSGLFKPNSYQVTSSSGVGDVSSQAMIESDNQCGDALLSNSVETATVSEPLLIESEILCVDDGNLGLSLCLTWRMDETDVACGVQGASAGLYPSSATGGHCETYEVSRSQFLQ